MRGAIWVALGKNAEREATKSVASFKKYNRLPARVLKELSFPVPGGLTIDQQAHWAKVSANQWTPYRDTLMLDADTRIRGDLSLGFKMLGKGWEVILVPSVPPQTGAILWNLSGAERRYTLEQLGTWRYVMFNTGVMYFRNTKGVRELFECWREEWLQFKDRDQGALLRALRKCPVALWLIGHPFNSRDGEVVNHFFGRAR